MVEIKKVSGNEWKIEKSGKMNVPAIIYASEKLLEKIKEDSTLEQIKNVAFLPGIIKAAYAMPDAHQGYGFPIGGVAAFDIDKGIISPGGVGYDINCSVRLLRTNLKKEDIEKKKKEVAEALFRSVPSGVGRGGRFKMDKKTIKEVLEQGAQWAVKNNYGKKEDYEKTEDEGRLKDADVSCVSDKAISRGMPQLGSLGAGNHFLEVQYVDEIFDSEIAKVFGIEKGKVTIMIHCLPGNSKIMTEYGYTLPIENIEDKWKNINIKCMDVNVHKLENTAIEKFLKVRPYGKIFKITTKSGKEIVATEDHPILTQEGLKFINEINENDKVAVLPFEGVEYQEPSDEVIVSEEDIKKTEGNARIVNKLKERGLLPLKYNSWQLPILTKLLGFLTGDGWLGKSKDRILLKFIGKKEDLEEIKRDIEKIDYGASRIYSQNCRSKIKYSDGRIREINGITNTIVIESLSLPILFRALGAPFGNKSKNKFEIPGWLFKAPLWIKRLYLAGYFGAEMTKPNIREKEKYRFGNPALSLNKLENLRENGKDFLLQIKSLLKEFDIPSIKITEHGGVITKSGDKTIKLRLKLSSKEENLKKLWGRVGFEYCSERTMLSSHALQYLNLKQKLLEAESKSVGKPISKLFITSFRFRNTDCPSFNNFILENKLNPPTPVIWDVVFKKEEVKDFKGYVYDFRVNHKDHNFIADGFVTGNCGSRGLGHQVASDYIREMEHKYGFANLPDRELVNAPIKSELGEKYYKAMCAAANFAFANKQMITHWVRETMSKIFPGFEADVVYDVCHNIAKFENHVIDGKEKKVLIMRKGATRSFGPGRKELPKDYREVGQPVIIPGSMGTSSYLLVGTKKAEEISFASTAHGAGRVASRASARNVRGEDVVQALNKKGIEIRAGSWKGLAEEAPEMYKDIDEVVKVSHEVGIGNLVARLKPMTVMKG